MSEVGDDDDDDNDETMAIFCTTNSQLKVKVHNKLATQSQGPTQGSSRQSGLGPIQYRARPAAGVVGGTGEGAAPGVAVHKSSNSSSV